MDKVLCTFFPCGWRMQRDKIVAIIIIGGGYAQLPIIEEAKQLGYESIVVDDRPNIPAEKTADTVLKVGRYDINAICSAISKIKIDAIVTGGSDKGVLEMSLLAEKFGVPSYVSPNIARLPTEKNEMQSFLQSSGVHTPRTITVSDKTELSIALKEIGYPAVIKPADGIGQVAVSRVDNSEQAFTAFEQACSISRNGTVLVQTFLEGGEFGVNGFVINGCFHLLTISERNASQVSSNSFGVAYSKKYPAYSAMQFKDKIVTEVTKAVDSLGLRFSPIYCQLKLTNGQPIILEIMPRLGGGEDPRLVHYATGVNICKATILASLGMTFTLQDITDEFHYDAVVMKFLVAKEGKITSISGLEEARKVPFIKQIICYALVNDSVKIRGSSSDRLGVVIAAGDTLENVEFATETASEKIKIIT